ncbi:hypothetical protein EMCRGX_G029792 [Ephydatia muelleri]
MSTQRNRRKGKLDYWAICGDSTNGARSQRATVQDKEFQEFRTTRVTGGGYKGIPNGLKQSRPVPTNRTPLRRAYS